MERRVTLTVIFPFMSALMGAKTFEPRQSVKTTKKTKPQNNNNKKSVNQMDSKLASYVHFKWQLHMPCLYTRNTERSVKKVWNKEAPDDI